MQPAYVAKSAISAGAAAMAGEEEKDHRHDSEVNAAGGYFYPIIVESFGLWTSSSLATLKVIASKTTAKSRISFSSAVSNLLQQLSVRLFQFSARMICTSLRFDTEFDFWDLPTLAGDG